LPAIKSKNMEWEELKGFFKSFNKKWN
jgi:hypothetical protein